MYFVETIFDSQDTDSDIDLDISETISDISAAYTEIDEEQNQRQNIISIRILYFTMFLSSVGFSISLPSIWPYLKALDPEFTKEKLGLVVAIFSVGQLFGSLILGFIVSQFDSFKMPLVLSIVVMTIGNCIYTNLFILPNKRWSYTAMIVSRVVIGLGSGNVAIVRAYITTFAESNKRTAEIALMSASQGLGFIFGPCIQTCFIPLGYPGLINYRFFVLNVFNAPGYFGILTCVLNIVVVTIYFHDKSSTLSAPPLIKVKRIKETKTGGIFSASYFRHHLKEKSDLLRRQSNIIRTNLQKGFCTKVLHPTGYDVDYLVIILIMTLFFSCMILFSSIETILTPMLMDNMAWSFSSAAMYGSIFLAACGISSVLIFISIGYSTKKFSEKIHLLFAQVILVLACIIMIPVFGPTPVLKYSYDKPDKSGCPVNEQPWCRDTPALSIWALIIALILFTFGYAICSVITTVLFSVMLGPVSQGIWMGLFTAIGSASRIIGPFYVTSLYCFGGLVIVFSFLAGFKILILACFLISYKRVVPFGFKM